MDISQGQMVLAAIGWYDGAIDGDAGPKTRAAILHAGNRIDPDWSAKRRLVGAVQAALTEMGHEPGPVDGYFGHNTREALIACLGEDVLGTGPVTVERAERCDTLSHPAQLAYPRQRDMEAFYGPAGGADCTAGKVALPFPLRLAWDRDQVIRRFSCHEKLATPMTGIFRAALAEYGSEGIERLELDLFGGCYNFRNMRGGSSLSTHAYGAAVDLNPEKNRLRWGADRAQFAQPEYEPFWRIVMAHGGTPAGYAWGKDWMHFQFARI